MWSVDADDPRSAYPDPNDAPFYPWIGEQRSSFGHDPTARQDENSGSASSAQPGFGFSGRIDPSFYASDGVVQENVGEDVDFQDEDENPQPQTEDHWVSHDHAIDTGFRYQNDDQSSQSQALDQESSFQYEGQDPDEQAIEDDFVNQDGSDTYAYKSLLCPTAANTYT